MQKWLSQNIVPSRRMCESLKKGKVKLGQDSLVSLYKRGLEVNFRRGFDFQGVYNRFLVREIENENDQIAAGNTHYITFNSTIS